MKTTFRVFIQLALLIIIILNITSCNTDKESRRDDSIPIPTGIIAIQENNKIKISWNSSDTPYLTFYVSKTITPSEPDGASEVFVGTAYDGVNYLYDEDPFEGLNYYKIYADDGYYRSKESDYVSCEFRTIGSAYIGVVAFNSNISVYPVSNFIKEAQQFITNKTNDVDRTALCYAVSKATTLFSSGGLPAFDKIFIISFTDGFDNGSSSLYVADNKHIAQGQVYDQAKLDLSAKIGLRSYAIGFGDEVSGHETDMKKLVVGGGEYKIATSASLNNTFQDIANSVLASAKNITLRTQEGLYTEDYPKYFRLTVTAAANSFTSTTESSSVICKLVGKTLSILTPGNFVSFSAPVTGILSDTDNKIIIPLNNLQYIRNSTEYVIKDISVEVSFDKGRTYYTDVEDSSTSEDISKNIAVVLVIDCSTSLGSAFSYVQTSANAFIDRFKK